MSSLNKFELDLHEALASPLGIEVKVEGPIEVARQRYYNARAQNLLLFENISITVSPFNDYSLWIVNKGGPHDNSSEGS